MISSPDILVEAHDRFRLKLIQKASWDFVESFRPAMAKEFEVICWSLKQQRDIFYSDLGTKCRSGTFQGSVLTVTNKDIEEGTLTAPKTLRRRTLGSLRSPFRPPPPGAGGGNKRLEKEPVLRKNPFALNNVTDDVFCGLTPPPLGISCGFNP